MEPQRPSNSDPKSASLILKQLKEAAKAAEDVDDYYDTEEDDDEDEEFEEDEEEIVGRFEFRVESNNDAGKVTKKKKLVASGGGSGKRAATGSGGGGGGGGAPSCCQVEKCGADLTEAKRYYKRHQVCEAHAKSPLVVVDGIRQRFCQQCSRFHELSEFDETRRSCRSRLAGQAQEVVIGSDSSSRQLKLKQLSAEGNPTWAGRRKRQNYHSRTWKAYSDPLKIIPRACSLLSAP